MPYFCPDKHHKTDMKMVHPIRNWLPALALLLATGCNSGVFIDEFLPEAPAPISLTEEASEATIRFEADNWEVKGITGQNPSEYLDYRIDKCDGRTLRLSLLQNLYDNPCELTIHVGNEYEERQLTVTLHPTSKYRIDSIVYDWSQFKFYDYMLEPVETITFDNQDGTYPARWTCYPYKKSRRKVSLNIPSGSSSYYPLDEEEMARYFGQRPCPSIPIPDVADGKPVMSGTEVAFGPAEQELDANLDKDLAVEVSIDAGKKLCVTVYNNMDIYDVPFTLYASHPRTGQCLEMQLRLHSECPVNYMIFKEDITNE